MRKNPPFVTRAGNSEGVWFDRLAAFLPIIAAAFLTGGARSLVLILTAALAAAGVEFVFCLALQRSHFSAMPIAMGLGVAMVCPHTIPLGMMAAGSAIAAAVANLLLHFKRSGLVSPSAVAWLVLLLCAPGVMSAFPTVNALQELPLFATQTQFTVQEGILAQLQAGILPNLSWQDLLFGNVSGGIGATAILAVMLSFLYLTIRRAGAWEVTVSLILTVLGLSLLLNQMAVPVYQFALLQLSAGSLWFAAVFMASDTGAPKTRWMRVIYGVVSGAGIVVMRLIGFDEFSVPFAIVAAGVLCNLCERLIYRLRCMGRSRRIER